MKKSRLLAIKIVLLGLLLTFFIPTALSDINTGVTQVWTMDDSQTSGTNVINKLVTGVNGTLSGSYETGKVGKIGEAYKYAGGGTGGTITLTALSMPATYTVSMWINFSSSIAAANPLIFRYTNYISFGYATNIFDWYVGSGAAWDSGGGPIKDLRDNKFHHLLFFYNGVTKNKTIWIDGVNLWGDISTRVASTSAVNYAISSNGYMKGSIDEVTIWNRILNTSEIRCLNGTAQTYPYSCGAPAPAPTPVINWAIYPPTSGDRQKNNSRMFFYNLTVAGANYCTLKNQTGTLFWNSTGAKAVNKKYNITATSLTQQTYKFRITCNNGTSMFNSTLKTLIVDTTSPTITINSNNAFSSTNVSRINQYLNNQLFKLNITFTDNQDLFGYLINITSGTYNPFGVTNVSVPALTTVLNYYKALNTSAWPRGVYKIFVQTVDRHTAQTIPIYSVKNSLNTLEFATKEENNIKIVALGALSSSYTKEVDKYSYGFNYLIPSKSKTFTIETDKEIFYFKDSKYKGHFVIWNSKTHSGNWLDFENVPGEVSVKVLSRQKYEITITDTVYSSSVDAKSLGGLNNYNYTYSWYKGNYTVAFVPAAIVHTSQIFRANLSRNSALVSNITARFYYNKTFTAVTRTFNANYADFLATVNLPSTPGLRNWSWLFNITQSDGSQYSWNYNASQDVVTILVNVTLYDEENSTLITEAGTVYLTGEQSKQVAATGGKATLTGLVIGDYKVEAETTSYSRRGIYFSAHNMSNNLAIYLCKTRTGNAFIDYTVLNSDQNGVSNATISLYRDYNTTEKTIFQGKTDFAGQIQIMQDQQYLYRMTIDTGSKYPYKNFVLQPIKTAYTIYLTLASASLYKNVFEGLTLQILPAERTLNSTALYRNVTFDLFADDLSIEYYGIILDNHTTKCIPISCKTNISSSPAGGRATVRILLNNSGTFNGHFFFKRVGWQLQFVNGRRWVYTFVSGVLETSITGWLANLKPQLGSKPMAAFLAMIMIIGIVATATQLGVYGAGITIVATICTAMFTALGYIPGLVGGVMCVVGILVSAAAYREE